MQGTSGDAAVAEIAKEPRGSHVLSGSTPSKLSKARRHCRWE